MSWRLYGVRGKFRSNTLTERFGSWNAGLRAAGVPVTQVRGATDAELFDNIATVWRKLGRQPAGRELIRGGGVSTFSESAYKRRFGSWHKALRAFERFVNNGSRDARLPAPSPDGEPGSEAAPPPKKKQAYQAPPPHRTRHQMAPARHGADPRQLPLPHVRRQPGEGSCRDPACRSHRAMVEGRQDRTRQPPDALPPMQHRQERPVDSIRSIGNCTVSRAIAAAKGSH